MKCLMEITAKFNGKDTDILYTFNLTEPPGYLINIIPTDILYQSITKDLQTLMALY